MDSTLFNHIGIVGKYGARGVGKTIEQVLAILDNCHIAYTLDAATLPAALQAHPRAAPLIDWRDGIDLCIVIGGDGTFLHAGRVMLSKKIPLLGVNAGRLGFLADVSTVDLDRQLKSILGGNYSLEMRQTLQVDVRHRDEVRASFYAINDAVIHKRTMARMVELNAYTRGQFLCHYRADGLILSTPTGSTAYALSAGGPILEPNMEALILAPICPHTLTHRPMVIGPGSEIEVTFDKGQQDIQLTIDGQEELILQGQDRLLIRPAHPLPVIHPQGYQFQRRLREKFNWGMPVQTSEEPRDA